MDCTSASIVALVRSLVAKWTVFRVTWHLYLCGLSICVACGGTVTANDGEDLFVDQSSPVADPSSGDTTSDIGDTNNSFPDGETDDESTDSTATKSTGINWHPGHYAILTPHIFRSDGTADGTTYNSYAKGFHDPIIDTICDKPEWKGVAILLSWGAYEQGSTPGNFTNGRAVLNTILDKLESCGKKLTINFTYAVYNTGSNTTSSGCVAVLPQYLITNTSGQYGVTPTNSGSRNLCYSRFWQAATMDRYIAATQDIVQQFGDRPGLDTIFFWELSVPNMQDGRDGYSDIAMQTQFLRWLAATRSAAPKQQIRAGIGWSGTDAQLASLFEACRQYKCSYNASDTLVNNANPPNMVYAGYLRNDAGTWVQSGTDYRLIVPYHGQTEWYTATATPAEFWFAANNDHVGSNGITVPNPKASYFFWTVDTWDTDHRNWTTSVRPFIETTIDGAINYTSCPTGWTCNTN